MLAQQSLFSPPPPAICPGDDATFTCAPNDTLAIIWSVSPGGADDRCEYLVFNRQETTCGPDGRFTSFQTERRGSIYNTSLRADSVTEDLNNTVVQCSADRDVIGSSSICIVGEH